MAAGAVPWGTCRGSVCPVSCNWRWRPLLTVAIRVGGPRRRTTTTTMTTRTHRRRHHRRTRSVEFALAGFLLLLHPSDRMPMRAHIARVHKGCRGPPPADARDCDWEGTNGSVSCLVGQWEGARSSFVAFPATLQSDRPFSFVVPVASPPWPAEAFLAFYSCASTMGPAESSPPPRALCGGGGHDDGGGGRTAEAGLADGRTIVSVRRCRPPRPIRLKVGRR
jgi:hypothetical protein